MKKFLFAVLALSILALFMTSCQKEKQKVKYRVFAQAGAEINNLSIIAEEFVVPENVQPDPSNPTIVEYEWMGIKENQIQLVLVYPENTGGCTIELYADEVLIGKVTGSNTTLFVDRRKK